jgi:hypothetical protein
MQREKQVSDHLEKLKSRGLSMFWIGGLATPIFSLVVAGEELWKQVTRIGCLALAFLGFCLYAYAVIRSHRSR